MKPSLGAKRGRPHKFGRPSQLVAVTLPAEVVSGLRTIHPDLGWAIVSLFERAPKGASQQSSPHADVELVAAAEGRSLIVVKRSVFKRLPGISIIPLNSTHAFLALETGRGLADLELAVGDRLTHRAISRRERNALSALLAQLRVWRHDRALRFHTRAIIVVERIGHRELKR